MSQSPRQNLYVQRRAYVCMEREEAMPCASIKSVNFMYGIKCREETDSSAYAACAEAKMSPEAAWYNLKRKTLSSLGAPIKRQRRIISCGPTVDSESRRWKMYKITDHKGGFERHLQQKS